MNIKFTEVWASLTAPQKRRLAELIRLYSEGKKYGYSRNALLIDTSDTETVEAALHDRYLGLR